MKNSDKIRLLIAVLIGCVAIIVLVWTMLAAPKNPAVSEVVPPQAEQIVQDEATALVTSGDAVTGHSIAEEETGSVQTGATSGATQETAGVASSSGTAKTASVASSSATVGASVKKPAHEKNGNSLFRSEVSVTYAKTRVTQPQNPEQTLTELKNYWETIGLDALRDLWELERYQALTIWLGEHPEIPYYYCGDKNAQGQPEGKGVAVYSGNRFYYGDWKSGRREGKGEWFQFYPERMKNVVTLHEYTGDWVGDLPDGEGVELFEYDLSRMDGVSYYPQNVIGHFSKGLYDGEMSVTLIDEDNSISIWKATCTQGVWQPFKGEKDADGKIPVLYKEDEPKVRRSFWPEYSKNQGVDHVQ